MFNISNYATVNTLMQIYRIGKYIYTCDMYNRFVMNYKESTNKLKTVNKNVTVH